MQLSAKFSLTAKDVNSDRKYHDEFFLQEYKQISIVPFKKAKRWTEIFKTNGYK